MVYRWPWLLGYQTCPTGMASPNEPYWYPRSHRTTACEHCEHIRRLRLPWRRQGGALQVLTVPYVHSKPNRTRPPSLHHPQSRPLDAVPSARLWVMEGRWAKADELVVSSACSVWFALCSGSLLCPASLRQGTTIHSAYLHLSTASCILKLRDGDRLNGS